MQRTPKVCRIYILLFTYTQYMYIKYIDILKSLPMLWNVVSLTWLHIACSHAVFLYYAACFGCPNAKWDQGCLLRVCCMYVMSFAALIINQHKDYKPSFEPLILEFVWFLIARRFLCIYYEQMMARAAAETWIHYSRKYAQLMVNKK